MFLSLFCKEQKDSARLLSGVTFISFVCLYDKIVFASFLFAFVSFISYLDLLSFISISPSLILKRRVLQRKKRRFERIKSRAWDLMSALRCHSLLLQSSQIPAPCQHSSSLNTTHCPLPTHRPWPQHIGAMLVCPRPIWPRPKILGCYIPWTKCPLTILPLTKPSHP